MDKAAKAALMQPDILDTVADRDGIAGALAERDILKESRGLLREGPHMIFSFIAKHRANG